MKFRTKLFLSFALLWLVLAFVGRSWFTDDLTQMLIQVKRTKAMGIAAAVAKTISGDTLAQIHSPEDPAFKIFTAKLLRIRQANQRNDIHVSYIYVIAPVPNDPSQIQITIDVKDPPLLDQYFIRNEIWPQAVTNGIAAHLQQNWGTEKIYTDRMGAWLTGIAPVFDSKGQYVATIAVDLSGKAIAGSFQHLLLLSMVTMGTALLLGLIAAILIARNATRSLDMLIEGVDEIGHGNLKFHIDVDRNDEFGQLACAINAMEKGLKENERLKLNFARYVSKHVMEQILLSDVSTLIKGERKKITVLVCDIRQFTALSERLAPEELVCLLNEFLEQMLAIIFDNNGTLDKFLGDGILAEFGAPLNDPQQEKQAVKTAIDMYRALQKLNQKWGQEGRPTLEFGIGIHTGLAIVGNVGSELRMEYTAIGDTVNIAHLMQQATKEQKVPILVSETTAKAISGQFKMRSLGELKLLERKTPIGAFAIEV
ncbi:MAG: adenylate/guanylate cyclase domain-containing protein [Chlamydiia bacterium]|nr:adenylate/guanylate cyclase domain-containing protein [Chlamydiia bacterium]